MIIPQKQHQSGLSKSIYKHLIVAVPFFKLGEDADISPRLIWRRVYEHESSSHGIRLRSGSTKDASPFSTGSGSLGTSDGG